MKEAEQNLSAEKLSENWTSGSGTTTEVSASPEKGNNAELSPETVAASLEKANSAEFQIEMSIVPRETQPRPCSKTSKWACFACCDFQ